MIARADSEGACETKSGKGATEPKMCRKPLVPVPQDDN